MSPPVPRIGRVLDAVGLVLFLLGAGVYGWAWRGLRRLQLDQPTSATGLEFAAVSRADELSILSRVGLAVMAGGAVVAVVAAVVARRRASGDDG